MTPPRACLIRQVDRIEMPVLREAEALRQAGYHVDLVMMRPPGATHWADLPEGVTARTVPLRRRKGRILGYVVDYGLFAIAAAVLVAWLHLRHRYRVVQVASLPDALVIAGKLPQLLGAALVMKVAEPTPQLSRTVGHPPAVARLLGWMQVSAARTADGVVTVTEELADDLAERGVERGTIHVVLNGPSETLASFATGEQPDPERFTIVTHGTILERYGQDTILRAAALLLPEIPQLRVVFTGSGPYWSELEALIDELGLHGVVEHHEWLAFEDLVRLLERCDVGIVAQKSSPYSNLVHTNKMFEYMLLGIPAVCSRLQATESVVPEGVVRYFEPDHPDDLAAVLLDLHQAPRERERLAATAGAAYARLGWEASQRDAYLAAVEQADQRRRLRGRARRRRHR